MNREGDRAVTCGPPVLLTTVSDTQSGSVTYCLVYDGVGGMRDRGVEGGSNIKSDEEKI